MGEPQQTQVVVVPQSTVQMGGYPQQQVIYVQQQQPPSTAGSTTGYATAGVPQQQVIYQQAQQTQQPQVRYQQTVVAQDPNNITICSSGCGCCTFATMITFLIIFIIEMIFAISFKEGADNISDGDDLYSSANDIGHLADFLTIMYGVEIFITLIFLITWYIMRLYQKWYTKQQNHCFMIMALFGLWFIAAIIVSVAYEGEHDTDLSLGRVLGLIILFTICGPFCILCCGW